MAALTGGVLFAAAPPARAVSGLQWVANQSEDDNNPTKSVRATCPAGKYVLGGGGRVSDGDRREVRLTALKPVHYRAGDDADRFDVKAEAPSLGRAYDWSLTAYAICADSSALRQYEVRTRPSSSSSNTFQTAQVSCLAGTVAYGAGAQILPDTGDNVHGHVGLQLNRTSGRLDIARATAREDVYTENWRVESTAVCAKPSGGIHAEGRVVDSRTAGAACPGAFRVHGAGGGGGLRDGGPVWLQRIAPRRDLRRVSVAMTGALPSSIGVVAHQTCAR